MILAQCDDSLWSPLLLHSLMAAGTNERLKLHFAPGWDDPVAEYAAHLPQLILQG